jgi:hypothetical protein
MTYHVVVDEFPSTIEHFTLTPAHITKSLGVVGSEWRKEIEPWAESLIAGVPNERARLRASLLTETPPTHLTPSYDTQTLDEKRIAKTFEPVSWAQNLRRAAHPSARFVFEEDKITVTRLTDMAAHLQAEGGTIMSAGLPTIIVKALRPDAIIARIDVADPPGRIERVRVLTPHATTKELFEAPDRVRAILADTLGRRPGSPTLIVCAMKLEPIAKEFVGDLADVRHYGAMRGLDLWMGCEVFATIGDHYENLGSVDAEAAYFGVDARALSRSKLATELEQAHGRARDVRRTTPALHLHYGLAWPGRWTCENTRTELR